MNDILLKKIAPAVYDWTFNGVDVENVTGDQRIINNIIETILLKPYELEQSIYREEGCKAHNYIFEQDTPENLELIKNEIKISCKTVKDVRDADIKATIKNGQIETEIIIYKEDGGVIEIGI